MDKVIFQGKEYRSGRAIAKAFNIPSGTYKNRLNAGWPMEEILGLKEHVVTKEPWRSIVVEGKKYVSISHAAKAYGLPDNLCRDRLDLGWSIDEVFGIFENKSRKLWAYPTTIDGIKYDSVAQAARELEMPTTTLTNRLKSKTFDQTLLASPPLNEGRGFDPEDLKKEKQPIEN